MDRTDKGSTVRRNALSRWWRGRARHGLISLFMWLGMLVVLVLMAARMVPSSHSAGRVIPELVAFVPFAVLPTLVVVLLSTFWHRRILAVLSALCLVTLVVWHIGYFAPRHTLSDTARSATSTSSGTAPNTDDRVLRLMTLNTLNGRVSTDPEGRAAGSTGGEPGLSARAFRRRYPRPAALQRARQLGPL